jgi:hypothetical protein
LAVLLLTTAAFAVIVDRIVVTVATQAITESELEITIRLTSFLNQTDPDFSAANRRKTVERMIEQRIVLKELDFTRYPRPSMEEVGPRLANIVKPNYLPNILEFGRRVALNGNGQTLLVGQPSENSAAQGIDGNWANTAAPQSGAVWLY